MASAATTTLKLGTAVIVVPARNPITLAKEVAPLDMYSRGRVLLGVGVGGLRGEGARYISPCPRLYLIPQGTPSR